MYEAAVNPGLWAVALAALATEIEAGSADLAVFDKRAIEPPFAIIAGPAVTPDLTPLYVEYYCRLDPLIPSAAAQPVSKTVMLCQEYVSPETVAKSECYQDYLVPKLGRYSG